MAPFAWTSVHINRARFLQKFLSIEPVLRLRGQTAVIEKGLLHLSQMTIPLEILLDGPVSVPAIPRAFVANGLS